MVSLCRNGRRVHVVLNYDSEYGQETLSILDDLQGGLATLSEPNQFLPGSASTCQITLTIKDAFTHIYSNTVQRGVNMARHLSHMHRLRNSLNLQKMPIS